VPESIIPSADTNSLAAAGVSFQMLSRHDGPFAWEFPGRLLLRRQPQRAGLSRRDGLPYGRETRRGEACQRGCGCYQPPMKADAASPWSACTVSGHRRGPCL